MADFDHEYLPGSVIDAIENSIIALSDSVSIHMARQFFDSRREDNFRELLALFGDLRTVFIRQTQKFFFRRKF